MGYTDHIFAQRDRMDTPLVRPPAWRRYVPYGIGGLLLLSVIVWLLVGVNRHVYRVPIDRLQAFYRKFYQPDNVMVIVAGNFKEDKALAYLSKYFGALKKPQRRLEETSTSVAPASRWIQESLPGTSTSNA